jgi:MFS family permease
MRGAASLVCLMCLAEVLAMLGFGTFAALLPTLRGEWGLGHAAAGWIEGAFQAGYLAAVPVLVTLTDRVDARRVFSIAALVGGIASLGFALYADGLWSACALRALAGVGLAGTFMPGLRILSDRIEGAGQSRATAFYTASFSVGASLSIFLAGALAQSYGWRWAFGLPALGAFGAAAIAATRSHAPQPPRQRAHLLDLGPALRNRPALAYNLAYACHMWELYGFRAWLVAFLTFCIGVGSTSDAIFTPATLASLILLLGLPASVLGNEAALRFGRRRVIVAIMSTSALTSVAIGASGAMSLAYVLVISALYSITVSADSASLTAGAVGAADSSHRGATMTMHTLVGFAAATLGPLAFGGVLDLIGAEDWLGWAVAFAMLGIGVALGPVALRLVDRTEGKPGYATGIRGQP